MKSVSRECIYVYDGRLVYCYEYLLREEIMSLYCKCELYSERLFVGREKIVIEFLFVFHSLKRAFFFNYVHHLVNHDKSKLLLFSPWRLTFVFSLFQYIKKKTKKKFLPIKSSRTSVFFLARAHSRANQFSNTRLRVVRILKSSR